MSGPMDPKRLAALRDACGGPFEVFVATRVKDTPRVDSEHVRELLADRDRAMVRVQQEQHAKRGAIMAHRDAKAEAERLRGERDRWEEAATRNRKECVQAQGELDGLVGLLECVSVGPRSLKSILAEVGIELPSEADAPEGERNSHSEPGHVHRASYAGDGCSVCDALFADAPEGEQPKTIGADVAEHLTGPAYAKAIIAAWLAAGGKMTEENEDGDQPLSIDDFIVLDGATPVLDGLDLAAIAASLVEAAPESDRR